MFNQWLTVLLAYLLLDVQNLISAAITHNGNGRWDSYSEFIPMTGAVLGWADTMEYARAGYNDMVRLHSTAGRNRNNPPSMFCAMFVKDIGLFMASSVRGGRDYSYTNNGANVPEGLRNALLNCAQDGQQHATGGACAELMAIALFYDLNPTLDLGTKTSWAAPYGQGPLDNAPKPQNPCRARNGGIGCSIVLSYLSVSVGPIPPKRREIEQRAAESSSMSVISLTATPSITLTGETGASLIPIAKATGMPDLKTDEDDEGEEEADCAQACIAALSGCTGGDLSKLRKRDGIPCKSAETCLCGEVPRTSGGSVDVAGVEAHCRNVSFP